MQKQVFFGLYHTPSIPPNYFFEITPLYPLGSVYIKNEVFKYNN